MSPLPSMTDLFESAEGPLWGLERSKAVSFAKGARQHFFSIIRTRLRDKKILLQAAEIQRWECAYCEKDLLGDPYRVSGTIKAEADHFIPLSVMFNDIDEVKRLLENRDNGLCHEYEAAIARANDASNLIASCSSCNLKRGDQDAVQFWEKQNSQLGLQF